MTTSCCADISTSASPTISHKNTGIPNQVRDGGTVDKDSRLTSQNDTHFFVRLPDLWLFLPALLLTFLGLTVVLSIVPDEFSSKVIYTLLGIGAFLFLASVDFRLLTAFGIPLLGFQVFLLVITLLFASEIRGSRRWLNVFGTTIQASELVKPFLVLGMSTISSYLNVKQLSHFFLSVAVIGVPILLVFLQPDLGTTIIITAIGAFSIFVQRPAKRYLVLCFLVALISLPVVWHCLADYQKERVVHFLEPDKDPLGASYNQIQAVIAAGSGQIFGKGLGKGTQSHLHFLPEKHTDFFFASLAEELGFLGSSVVVILFFLLSARLLYLAQQDSHLMTRIVLYGAFMMFFIQSSIHIGINLGILPVTGVTLPLLSVGGSSTLASWITLGLAASASREVKTSRTIFLR